MLVLIITDGSFYRRHRRKRSRRKHRPKKMPSAGINPKEFRQTQPLVIMRALEGEIKHNLDLEKSVEISDIKFDPALNEITHIGSNIDRFDVSQYNPNIHL
ncbi:hypothetical protein Q1695_014270 [Nippostrongylus brasiliensis]|nr:hypothetical protein Q1695_014270 [Nippostrongylus brasiliensis]